MKSRLKFLTLLILVVVDTSMGYSKTHSSAMGLTQTITFNPIPDKTYGDVQFALNASTDSDLDITYTSSDPGIASITDNMVTIYASGTITITASQDGDGTYDPATPVQQTLTINKATLIATANDKSMSYGDPTPVFTVTLSGFLNGDNETMIDATPDATSLATSTSVAGVYDIIPAGGVDSNYDFNYVDGHLTINKAILTVTADDKSRVYGDDNPLFTVSISGFKNGENQSNLDATPEGMTAETPTSDVGMYAITVSGGIDTNYDFSLVDGVLTITQANLVATADNQVRSYGDPNPELTITYVGFKNNDTPSELATQPAIQCTAIETSSVGNYPITLVDGSDNNYNISMVGDSLSVVKSILTITADDQSMFYGDEIPALTFSYSGFKNNETSSVLNTPPSLTCDATQSSDAGSYPITVSGGSGNNYDFNYVNGVLTINKASQTITFAILDNVVESARSFELTASSSSGLPVTFATDDSDKITITNSTVSIISAGKITITASQDGNSNYLTAGPMDQTICILPNKPTITSSGIVTTHPTLISSSNSGNQWYQENTLLVDANNSTYVVESDGMYTVQVTIEGCVSEISEPYSAIVLGLEPTSTKDFKIYPIPAKSELNVDIPWVTEIDVSEIFIYDLSGRLVIKDSITGNKSKIDVSSLPPALYLLNVTNQRYTSTSRFIKE